VKATMVSIISWASLILGSCVLAFACLLALLAWGGSPGSWPIKMPGLVRELEIDMAISAAIGLAGIALGLRMRRMKGGVNDDRLQNGYSKE